MSVNGPLAIPEFNRFRSRLLSRLTCREWDRVLSAERSNDRRSAGRGREPVGIGVLLSLAALLALTGAATLVWDGTIEWPHTHSLFGIVERLLFVLMLVEILHTVRASIQSHVLTCEPFLVVGMIATIRRILVVTLKTSDRQTETTVTSGAMPPFNNAMIDLSVLGLLTLVLAVAIYLARRSRA
jgi:uncharacterized membrane protein (DUF373 family)